VKKSTKKTRQRTFQPVAAKPVELEAMNMVGLRGHISNLVCADAVEMVSATIGQVHDGHYQAMKYLFEMIGLFPATTAPDAPQEDPLARILLRRLGIRDEALPEGQPSNHVK
jgi:hypothetical protein